MPSPASEGPIRLGTVLTPVLAAAILLACPIAASAQRAPQPVADEQSPSQEPAIELSDAYYTRLAIHRAGSYAILPLFAAQYYLGNRLMNDEVRAGWIRPTHRAVAAGVGAVFVVNTVTGALNLWESRTDPTDRTRRFAHVALMLAADAGFAYTGLVASQDASDLASGADRHRNAALVSVGLASAGTVLMWLRGSD